MDWATIRDIAREVDLWLGLAVNLWLLTSGVIIYFRRPAIAGAVKIVGDVGLAVVLIALAAVLAEVLSRWSPG